MKEKIYLYVDKTGVQRMRKTLGEFKRGEIPVALTIEIDNKAFTTPTIEQSVYIEDWNHSIDVDDVSFDKNVITKEEAEMIRIRRLEKMQEILRSQGYLITKDDEVND